ncbi:hypothetical protein TrVE_jg8997 [Triparma verrucosa]|uniref:Uncharacterized protein n=1 Tax=Triparma verrucosa TaxID=1606542 RepID=A0A9W7FMI6_9STRA|nr:hypothetical protein TrVE_jg8997 [Triparma verrucosa]
MADEGFVQPGYDLDIFEYRLGLRKETLQRRGRNIRKAAKEQKSMGASKLFGSAVEASVEKKREDAGGPRFHLAAAAAGLGGGGVKPAGRRWAWGVGVGGGGGEGGAGAEGRTEGREVITLEPYKPKMTQAELALERWIVYLGLIVLGVVLMVLVWLTLGMYGLYVVFFGGGVGAGAGAGAGAGVGLGGVGVGDGGGAEAGYGRSSDGSGSSAASKDWWESRKSRRRRDPKKLGGKEEGGQEGQEGGGQEEEGQKEEEADHAKEERSPARSFAAWSSSYLPSVDYLLEFFDYNVDEDRVFGQKNYTWPLQERVQFGARKKFGEALDRLGFAKGNFSFDGSLKSVIDDFRLTEETFDEERAAKGSLKGRIGEGVIGEGGLGKGVIGKGGLGEGVIGKGGLGEGIRRGATAAGGERKIPKPFKYGRELPFIYANLVKNIALIFTFGGALSFLAERFEEKVKERGTQVIKTDAQGIPFRCIVLVVICNVGFFGAAAIIAGINVEEGEAGGGPWTSLFLAGMVLSLTSHFAVLNSGSGWRDVIGRVWAPAPWKGSPPEGGDQGTGTGKGEAEGGENGIEMSKM